jgi:Arc/MetJ-type ribon-helix-helix transcriptional regulator
MPPVRLRSKMISVRLSEAEYRGIKTLCDVGDARSVSEAARKAMQALLSDGACLPLDPHLQKIHTRVEALDGRVARLDREISRIVEILSTAKQ